MNYLTKLADQVPCYTRIANGHLYISLQPEDQVIFVVKVIKKTFHIATALDFDSAAVAVDVSVKASKLLPILAAGVFFITNENTLLFNHEAQAAYNFEHSEDPIPPLELRH